MRVFVQVDHTHFYNNPMVAKHFIGVCSYT